MSGGASTFLLTPGQAASADVQFTSWILRSRKKKIPIFLPFSAKVLTEGIGCPLIVGRMDVDTAWGENSFGCT